MPPAELASVDSVTLQQRPDVLLREPGMPGDLADAAVVPAELGHEIELLEGRQVALTSGSERLSDLVNCQATERELVR